MSRITLEWYKQWLLPGEVVLHGMDTRITDANQAEILFGICQGGRGSEELTDTRLWRLKRASVGDRVVQV